MLKIIIGILLIIISALYYLFLTSEDSKVFFNRLKEICRTIRDLTIIAFPLIAGLTLIAMGISSYIK